MFQNNGAALPAAGIAGIGVDIVEINRLKNAAARTGNKFLHRVFTSSERCYCEAKRDRFACYAARFAAKEAVLKALGTGLAGARWLDVEVDVQMGGCPMVQLHGKAAVLAGARGIGEILISLSHDRARAIAFAVAVRKEA